MFSNIMVAIDTLCGTPYKLFKFSDPLSDCGEGEDTYDHGTRKLWDMWRKRVLSGAAMNVPLSDALAKTEEKGMSSRMRWDCMIPIDF